MTGATWEVTSTITGLSTTDTDQNPVWRRDKNAKNGLTWVDSETATVSSGTWSSTTITGTEPTGGTAYLADIVGSRTITVKVTVPGGDTAYWSSDAFSPYVVRSLRMGTGATGVQNIDNNPRPFACRR